MDSDWLHPPASCKISSGIISLKLTEKLNLIQENKTTPEAIKNGGDDNKMQLIEFSQFPSFIHGRFKLPWITAYKLILKDV